jgi:hypothetical protein
MATSTTPPDTMLSRKFFSDGVGDVWHDQRRGHARRGQPGRHLLLHGRTDGHRPRPRLQGLERRRGGASESGDDGQRRRDGGGGHGEDQGELTNSIKKKESSPTCRRLACGDGQLDMWLTPPGKVKAVRVDREEERGLCQVSVGCCVVAPFQDKVYLQRRILGYGLLVSGFVHRRWF